MHTDRSWNFGDIGKRGLSGDLPPGDLDGFPVIRPPAVCQFSLATSVSKHGMTVLASRIAQDFFADAGYGPHSHHGPGTAAFSLRASALFAALSEDDISGDLEALFARRERLIIDGASSVPLSVTPVGVTLSPPLLASRTLRHSHSGRRTNV